MMKPFTLFFTISIIFLISCADEEPVPEPEKPWELHDIEPGNFTINTGSVIINDGTRSGIYSDGTIYYNTYIIRDNLPSNIDFEYYTIRAYVPTNDAYGASIGGYGMSLYYGTQSERVRLPGDESQSRTIGISTIRGIQYSVFEIVVRDQSFFGTKENIDKIIFVFNVNNYLRSTNEVVNTDLVNFEILTDTEPSDSADTGSSGTGTFWVNQDYGCGFIDVFIEGQGTRKITSFFESNPGCSVDGSASFQSLPYGTYNYSASGSGCSWNNSFTISSSCATIQLTI